MKEFLLRKKRIIGRIISGKELPTFTYRWDERKPDAVRATGFQPWALEGNVSIIEHVTGAHLSGPKMGQLAKWDSQWVSTGSYGMLKKLDPVFAQKLPTSYLYKIDTRMAIKSGSFLDVNDTFDKANLPRPYASQREWLKDGGIPTEAIIQYMHGLTFYKQYNFTLGAPDEAALAGWENF